MGYFVGDVYYIPVSIFALGGALIFLLLASYSKIVDAKEIIKKAPWQIVWFSIGLYIVVYGLKNAGLTDYLHIVLMVATIAASYAFMLPIATPPNAIAMSSGVLKVSDMAKIGFLLNIVGVISVILVAYFVWSKFL